MKPTEKRAVQEVMNAEKPLRLFIVKYLIGKNSRKYGTVWNDTAYILPVMAKDSEHARRVARTAVAHALNTWHTKYKVQVREVSGV